MTRGLALLGAVEGGGTKFLCEVGHAHDDVVDSVRIDTTTPDQTLGEVVSFFRRHAIDALGVGMFGPLELRPGPERGSILRTPKPGWGGTPVCARLTEALEVPVEIDTDVNAAALGEHRFGAAQDVLNVLYVTVGTGFGGGVLVNGNPLHGLMHAELGHISTPVLDLSGEPDRFEGNCPFHGRCLEGLTSGPAIAARTGRTPEELPDSHGVWELTGRYIGHGLATAVLTVSPERIILGGGVGGRTAMLPVIRRALSESLAGYVPRPELLSAPDLRRYVVPPGLGGRSGLAGAFVLAARALGP